MNREPLERSWRGIKALLIFIRVFQRTENDLFSPVVTRLPPADAHALPSNIKNLQPTFFQLLSIIHSSHPTTKLHFIFSLLFSFWSFLEFANSSTYKHTYILFLSLPFDIFSCLFQSDIDRFAKLQK